MTRDHQHNPDPNQNAARIVAKSTDEPQTTASDVEAAWLDTGPRGSQPIRTRQ